MREERDDQELVDLCAGEPFQVGWFSAAMATWFRDASGASSTRTPISEASAKSLAITASRGVETPRWFLKKNATRIDRPPRPDGER